MDVREWHPASAPDGEVEGVLRALNAVFAADLSDDPPWQLTSFREYLAVTMPGERRVCWLALDGSEVVGYASVLLLGDIGVLELLVRPEARRRGVGARLLASAVRCADQEAFGALGVEVVGGTPAAGFFEANGFQCAYVEVRCLLRLAAVDWTRMTGMAGRVAAGYRIEYHRDGLPEPMHEAYAEAKASVRVSPVADLELRPSSYDAERLQASIATLRARGMTPHVVIAIDERTDTIAGLTEVVVPGHRPTRADQYDTIVVPAHRGYGIGRAIKARMLTELRSAEPQLCDVQTWNAMGNEPMREVNNELGFRPDRQWYEYDADVIELMRRL